MALSRVTRKTVALTAGGVLFGGVLGAGVTMVVVQHQISSVMSSFPAGLAGGMPGGLGALGGLGGGSKGLPGLPGLPGSGGSGDSGGSGGNGSGTGGLDLSGLVNMIGGGLSNLGGMSPGLMSLADGHFLHGDLTVAKESGSGSTVQRVQHGRVTSRTDSGVTVRSDDGYTMTWTVDKDTSYRHGFSSGALSDLTTDTDVMVVGTPEGAGGRATLIGQAPSGLRGFDGFGRPAPSAVPSTKA